MTPKANFGDLVRIAGYGARIFQVDAYRREQYFSPTEECSESVFELTDCGNGDYFEADAEDLTMIAPADQADEYLRVHPAPIVPGLTFNFDELIFGGASEMTKPPRKPTARELSGQEAERRKQARKQRAASIDNLLDIANWNRRQYEATGDVTFRDKVAEVEAELKSLVEAPVSEAKEANG